MISSRSAQACRRLLTGILAILLVTLAGCSSDGKTATPIPTPAQSTSSSSLAFVDFDLGLPAKALSAPVTATVPDDTLLHVVITFKTNQSTLSQLKSQKIRPGQTTNLQDQANKIGISDATYAQIKAYLGVENVTLKLDTLHTNLDVDGKAGGFAKIFQTHFVLHQLDGRTFFTPATAPKVPKFMADQIAAITGLDNYSQAPRNGSLRGPFTSTRATNHADTNCSTPNGVLTSAQVSHAYGYDKLWSQGWQGQGMTVNFVEMEGFDPRDVQNYFDCVHFHGHLKTVNVDTPPQPTSGFGEATLDMEMVAGLAPAINMVVYQSALDTNKATVIDFWTLFNDQLTQIVNDNAKANTPSVVSISWLGAEGVLTSGVVKAIETNLQLLTQAEHMTIFAASGDCGAFGLRVYDLLEVAYPATDPSVTAVGGTVLQVDGQGNRVSEVAWSDGSNTSRCYNQWGSGGGISLVFKQPDWASVRGMKNKYSTGKRQVPDLSAVALNLAMYLNAQWLSVGGTSAAAPIWAAGLSLVNQGLIAKKGEFVYGTDTFYAIASAKGSGDTSPLNDITKGNNLYYPATSGWDFATGLGTPNLPGLFNVIESNL